MMCAGGQAWRQCSQILQLLHSTAEPAAASAWQNGVEKVRAIVQYTSVGICASLTGTTAIGLLNAMRIGPLHSSNKGL